jgi:CHAD domain-containing protein
MAAARDVPLDPAMPFAHAAAATLEVRAQELWEQAPGVLDLQDIERVHAMRVATRRLRAVLEIFAPAFPKGEHGKVLREVTKLADALGARRDPDVRLEDLRALATQLEEDEQPGLDLLARRVAAEQQAANEVLAAGLARAEERALAARLRALAAAARGEETP